MDRVIEIKNAIIKAATIDTEDRGYLQVWLHLDYGGGGQGFGGYMLGFPDQVVCIGGYHILRCMEIAGVGKWGEVQGRPIRARIVGGMIEAIGHIIKDKWFCPKDEYADVAGHLRKELEKLQKRGA